MQTYANFRFNSCINLAEKAYKSVNARLCTSSKDFICTFDSCNEKRPVMKKILLSIFLCLPFLLSAQPYTIKHLSIREGLSNNHVVSIAQDNGALYGLPQKRV